MVSKKPRFLGLKNPEIFKSPNFRILGFVFNFISESRFVSFFTTNGKQCDIRNGV